MGRKNQPGSVIKIGLPNGEVTYARELKHPFVTIYDARGMSQDEVNAIIARPVLFTIAVHDSVFRVWSRIGHVPLRKEEARIPEQFIQDMFNPSDCRILNADGVERPASIDECRGLEPAAVWEADHVVERIQNYYEGHPSSFFEDLRLKTE